MITIDGAAGEGGGQVLRTTISLAMCLNEPVRIENIRAGRKRPGLLRQHLAAIRSAAEVCQATLTGDEIGSGRIEFRPGSIRSGDYRVAIGSAGSTTLVLQTILPALLLARGASSVVLEGGTHNGMAPSFDFLDLAFVPLLRDMGADVGLSLDRHGFYPNGGGRFVARVAPCVGLGPLELTTPVGEHGRAACITFANIPGHVAERERGYIQRKCEWDPEAI